jgi:molecular chaperone GrpE
MRHEWRGQTRENRQLAEEIHAASQQIIELQESLTTATPSNSTSNDESALKLVEALAEIDWHLSRVVEAASSFSAEQAETGVPDLQTTVSELYQQQGLLARKLSRKFHAEVHAAVERFESERRSLPDLKLEGLQLPVSRVQRILQKRDIVRIDTVGKPFDAELMHAIEAVDAAGHASAEVIEQLSPAYQWQGRVVRYAEVRIAR